MASPKGMATPSSISRKPTAEEDIRYGQAMDTEKGRQRTVTRDLGAPKTDSCQKAADHQEEPHVEYDEDY